MTLAHRLLDDVLDHLRAVPEGPAWRPVPAAVREALAEPLPIQGQGLERTCRDARELILPYPTGNAHPRLGLGARLRHRVRRAARAGRRRDPTPTAAAGTTAPSTSSAR